MMGIVGVDMKIKINRRPVVSLGVTYPNYEVDFIPQMFTVSALKMRTEL
jgi:hypothetical protein